MSMADIKSFSPTRFKVSFEKVYFATDTKRKCVFVMFRIRQPYGRPRVCAESFEYEGEDPVASRMSQSEDNTIVLKFSDRTERHQLGAPYIQDYDRNDILGLVMRNDEKS